MLLIRERTEPGTVERSALIARFAREVTWPDGKRRGRLLGEGTLRRWLLTYEQNAIAGLAKKRRSDRGRNRVTITRRCDKLAEKHGISEAARQEIADKLHRYIASHWRSSLTSAAFIAYMAQAELAQLMIKAGCKGDEEALKPHCAVPHQLVDRHRAKQAVAIKRLDAAKSAAVQTPRIRRDRSHLLPMQWVAADVHPIDIPCRREDGSIAHPRLIAFQDLATNRLFARVVLCPKGEAVRREHVIGTLAEMLADESWGCPQHLYVDRGGEFNWAEHIDLLCQYTRVHGAEEATREPEMLRAKAYNPQAKVIESAFASIEKTFFRLIAGHSGSDRLKPKTQNQGKAPIPFPGTFLEFKAEIERALAGWHEKPQTGHLAGKSPNQRFRELVAAGWRSAVVKPEELELHFADTFTRNVTIGGSFSVDKVDYRHDALLAIAGTRRPLVLIRRPLYGDRRRLYLFDENDRFIGIAVPAERFRFDDPAGAGEQARMQALFNGQIRAIERGTDKLDLQAEGEKTHAGAPGMPVPLPSVVVSIRPDATQAAELASIEESYAEPKRSEAEERTRRQRDLILRAARSRSA